VREAVDNAIGEILELVKAAEDNGYLKGKDLESMLKDIRRNLKTDPILYHRLVLRHLGPEKAVEVRTG